MISRQQRSRPAADHLQPSGILSLTVVFTTVPGTLAAIRRAADLARELAAEVRILIPQVVPYTLPVEQPTFDPERTVRHFRNLNLLHGFETRIQVLLCRDRLEGLKGALEPNSLVIVGAGRWQGFWKEHRLARALSRAGHQVIEVSLNRRCLTGPEWHG